MDDLPTADAAPAKDLFPTIVWGTLVVALLSAQLIIARGIMAAGQTCFNVDDALHATYAAALLHDLVHVDLTDLWHDIYDQGRWPPLGSVLQLPVLAVAGINELAHRIAMLLWLLPSGLVMAAAAALSVQERRGRGAAALVAASAVSIFLLLCRMAMVASASVIFEIPGVAAMILAYALAAGGWRRGRRVAQWLAAGALAASWFIKWQYGIVATVALAAAWAVARRPVKDLVRVVGPAVVAVGVWLMSPYHLREFWMYLSWREASLRHVPHYIAVMLRNVLVAPAWFKAVVGLGAVGCALGMRGATREPVRAAVLTHLLVAGAGSLMKEISVRTVLWLAAPVWVLAAVGWADVLGRALNARRLRGVAVVMATAALAAGWWRSSQVARGFESGRLWAGDGYIPEARWVAETVPLGARTLTIGGWARFISPWHLRWHYLRTHWHKPFSVREVRICEWPSLAWEPWRVRWKSPLALVKLRKPSKRRPARRVVPPEFVVVFRLVGGDKKVDQKFRRVARRFELKPYRQKRFPSGSWVRIYRCVGPRGADELAAGATRSLRPAGQEIARP